MTQDRIIELAREAGLYVGENLSGVPLVGHKKLEGLLIHLDIDDMARFAALVRNAALEEAAEVCDGVYHQHIGPQYGEVRYGIATCATAIRDTAIRALKGQP